MKKATSEKSWFKKAFKWLCITGLSAGVIGVSIGLVVFSVVYYRLPPIDTLTEYRPKVPLRIYTSDGVLIGEFGEERRDYVPIEEIPRHVRLAILAAEDNGFYEHSGIEFMGIARAAIANILTGSRGQGGSTITMQVARNFFLSSERSYVRKLYEVALAFKIEQNLSKDKIFEIYANQIFLGHRSYGFGSAAKTYFGKDLRDVSISEAAVLAGLPVAPSAYNPIVNIRRATMRRNYVLGRMLQLGYIDDITYETALGQPIEVHRPTAEQQKTSLLMEDLHAGYIAELARMLLIPYFGDAIYNQGLNVYTTIRSTDQRIASAAVRKALISYDRNYGYRGAEGHVNLGEGVDHEAAIRQGLAKTISSTNLLPGVVIDLNSKSMTVQMVNGEKINVNAKNFAFASKYIAGKNKKLTGRYKEKELRVGAIVRVTKNNKGEWTLGQIPVAESAFISADFNTGAIFSLVGGFDFKFNQFNHVTQAWRQPGSSFKPFIYSAALDKGFTPATIINDAPISIDPKLTGGRLWEPKNDDGKYEGPMSLARALERSKNLVSIRVMQAIDPYYAQQYLTRFGFEANKHPPLLTTALGAGSVTPWEMLTGFAVFANGGYLVQPYLIEKVVDADGTLLMQSHNPKAGEGAPRTIDARNAFVMNSLLQGVALRGTGQRAGRALKRSDIGAKTGTTNDFFDAWFSGYAGNIVAVGWMGYDQPKSLGHNAYGAGLVLPIWTEYMQAVLKGVPEYRRPQPPDVVEIGGQYFYADQVGSTVETVGFGETKEPTEVDPLQGSIRDQIF